MSYPASPVIPEKPRARAARALVAKPANDAPFAGAPTEGRWHAAEVGGTATATEAVFAAGSWGEGGWLSADFFNPHEIVLQLRLECATADGARVFELLFGLYPQVRARLRLPAEALALGEWMRPREGALLKPICAGDRVRAPEVATLRLCVLAGPEGEARWWQTPFVASGCEPARLREAETSGGRVLDAFGQAARREWPGKTSGEAELSARLREAAAERGAFPAGWSRWGGARQLRFGGTGFFRTHHDGRRWWLVDPGGHAFWSAGLCCVAPVVETRVEGLEHLLAWAPDGAPAWRDAHAAEPGHPGRSVDYLVANCIRAFGPTQWRRRWRRAAANFLRKHRFNTLGNWSDLELGRGEGLPYTRPMPPLAHEGVPSVFRDFPDAWHPGFSRACDAWAQCLIATRDDPALLGYFLCNEPHWAFAAQTPAAGMLLSDGESATRAAFARWLAGRYGDERALSAAWGRKIAWREVATGAWPRLPETALFREDAETFSTIMVARLFDTMAAACRKAAPNHLNLGARFANPPPRWMRAALGACDVFSFNSYSKKPRAAGAEIAAQLGRPVLIGEWHFGAADAGLPAAGLETVATQRDRAIAYRRFLEAHAEAPWCVGAHWFTLYDQSALGRFDGECYNTGFLDVCHREHAELCSAAQQSHERLYGLAAAELAPADLPPVDHRRRLSL